MLCNAPRADLRENIMSHDSLYSFLYIMGVSTHAPGAEPSEPQKYYISVTTSSKHVHENLLILICHTVI